MFHSVAICTGAKMHLSTCVWQMICSINTILTRMEHYTVDAFFAIDIILTIFVAYLDKRMFVFIYDLKKIAFW